MWNSQMSSLMPLFRLCVGFLEALSFVWQVFGAVSIVVLRSSGESRLIQILTQLSKIRGIKLVNRFISILIRAVVKSIPVQFKFLEEPSTAKHWAGLFCLDTMYDMFGYDNTHIYTSKYDVFCLVIFQKHFPAGDFGLEFCPVLYLMEAKAMHQTVQMGETDENEWPFPSFFSKQTIELCRFQVLIIGINRSVQSLVWRGTIGRENQKSLVVYFQARCWCVRSLKQSWRCQKWFGPDFLQICMEWWICVGMFKLDLDWGRWHWLFV